MSENRPTLNRRMREILQLIRQSNLEVSLQDDNQEISWNPGYLEKLGVLNHVFDLKNSKTFLQSEQPLFIVPNDERKPMGFYENDNIYWDENEVDDAPETFHYNEEDWEWAGILEGSETDVKFTDPYPNIPPWTPGNNADSRKKGPGEVPFLPLSEDDLVTASSYDMLQLEGMECLAWYSPKGNSRRPWGIYIQRYAAAFIAETFFSDMDNRYDAWCLASRLILNHEYFHFLSQYHCDRTYTGNPRTERYASYDAFWNENPLLIVEEAAANGFAYKRSALTPEERRSASEFFDSMPEPYRQHRDFHPPVGARAVVYQHEHQAQLPADLSSLNPTSDTVFKPAPNEKVPVHIIDFVPKGHTGPKMVIFDQISLSPQVRKRIRKGKVPLVVVKKLKKLITELRGGKFEKVKDLKCMNSKSHFVQKISNQAWRAIWAQVQGKNGWSVVFLGSHEEYEHYQTIKGL